jgi:hypothetical protein
MKWLKKRLGKKTADPADRLGNVSDLTFDELMIATKNVMACRDTADYFMSVIADHRADGHECPPFCMPLEMYTQLELLEPEEVKMLLVVILKDAYDAYHQTQTDLP